jgi:RNA polymerase sigma-B factor
MAAIATAEVPTPQAITRPPTRGIHLLREYNERGKLEARAKLIEQYLPLVHALARRYANGSAPLEDLVQTGSIGLIKAIDRFRLERGGGLACYAAPMIIGELRHYLRDSGWPVTVPRRVRERKLRLARLAEELAQTLGRAPTIAELAQAADLAEEAVIEALEAGQAASSVSLGSDGPFDPEALGSEGALERAYELSEDRVALAAAARVLDERERRILELRFVHDLTEAEIGSELDISQRRVSQLMHRALEKMRRAIANEQVGVNRSLSKVDTGDA